MPDEDAGDDGQPADDTIPVDTPDAADDDEDGDTPDAADGGNAGTEGDVPDAVSPRVLVAETLAPVHDLCSRGTAALGLPEPGVVAADVLAMPTHERFASSAERYADRLGVETLDAAGLERATASLPFDDPIERATTFLARRSGRLQGRALAQLARDPDRSRDCLVLAVAADHLQRAAVDCQIAVETADETPGDASDDALGDALDDARGDAPDDATVDPAGTGDVAPLASIALALTARLDDLVADALAEPTDRDLERAASDESLPDALVRDVALADHHRKRARGDTPGFDPLDRDVDALRDLVLVQGAALAVTELDADPGAVAALVDVPLEHVLGVLAAE